MISNRTKQYCRGNFEKIENYDLAMADEENVWETHHRLELTLNGEFAHSREELKRLGMYYDRPYYELIYLTTSEHAKLHGVVNDLRKFQSAPKRIGNLNGKFQKCDSEFGSEYFRHFGFSKSADKKLYNREYHHYLKYGKCRWE